MSIDVNKYESPLSLLASSVSRVHTVEHDGQQTIVKSRYYEVRTNDKFKTLYNAFKNKVSPGIDMEIRFISRGKEETC